MGMVMAEVSDPDSGWSLAAGLLAWIGTAGVNIIEFVGYGASWCRVA